MHWGRTERGVGNSEVSEEGIDGRGTKQKD